MATVYVGSARSDENGKAHGGKAGDQKSGNEVSSQKYYVHSKGWRVFRAKDQKKAVIIGDQMKAACDNNKIGYDQYERYDLFAEAKKVGYDLAKVAVATECDCSELVRCCCAAAGILDLPKSGFRTGNMPKNLLATGEFVELKGSKYTSQSAYLGKGDILVTATSGHTVVVLNNGNKYEGSIEEKEYALGERILRNGDSGPDVKLMQEYLRKVGFGKQLGESGVDGDFGDCTEIAVMEFQEKHGCAADGEYGPITHKAMLKAIEALEDPEEARTVRIVGGQCWIRTAPDSTNPNNRIVVAKEGSEYPYGGETLGGWHLIVYNKQNAWVSGKYSKVEG